MVWWIIFCYSIHLQALIDDAEVCRRKMASATALIDGLANEKDRWTEQGKQFQEQIQRYAEQLYSNMFSSLSVWLLLAAGNYLHLCSAVGVSVEREKKIVMSCISL